MTNPEFTGLVVAITVCAVCGLIGYVTGFLAGSKAGRKLAEREQARLEALDRIRLQGAGGVGGVPFIERRDDSVTFEDFWHTRR